MRNRQVILSKRPVGIPQAEHFELVERELAPLSDQQFLVKNLFLSVDPAMKGWTNLVGNYSAPVEIGAVMRAMTVAEVIESRHPAFKPGDKVNGMFGWQQYRVCSPAEVDARLTYDDLPLSLSLGILGNNGLTAYCALFGIGEPKPDDTVVVSTAAGAVGSIVGQLAKLSGCHTVGITGGPIKQAVCLSDFGFDHALDYKTAGSLSEALAAVCPRGVNVYFDNTSGSISDTVMGQLAIGSRVIICGTASIESWDPVPVSTRIERILLTKRVRVQGFLVTDHYHRLNEVTQRLARLVRDGKLKYREEVLHGLEACPDAVAGLYRGENLGKRVIKLT